MNKHSQRQTGSIHLIVIIVVVAGLLGSLGFIFWQHFIEKKNTSQTKIVQTTKPAEVKPVTHSYKTFTSPNSSLSFHYLDNWTASETTTTDTSLGTVTVKDSQGKTVAILQTGAQLGGTCDPAQAPIYTTPDASLTKVGGADPVYFSLTAIPDTNGGYDVHYGLTDTYTKTGTGTVCSNTFYYTFSSGSNTLGGIGFGNDIVATSHYSSLQAVKDFIASDEYAAIKKMVSSLIY